MHAWLHGSTVTHPAPAARTHAQARGVYEGSYWELMGDMDEMIEMLKKMSKASFLRGAYMCVCCTFVAKKV